MNRAEYAKKVFFPATVPQLWSPEGEFLEMDDHPKTSSPEGHFLLLNIVVNKNVF